MHTYPAGHPCTVAAACAAGIPMPKNPTAATTSAQPAFASLPFTEPPFGFAGSPVTTGGRPDIDRCACVTVRGRRQAEQDEPCVGYASTMRQAVALVVRSHRLLF